MKTYVVHVDLQQEEDGRWSAWVEALPGCAAWGNDRRDALEAIRQAVEAFIADALEAGEDLPSDGVEIVEAPLIAVTL